MEASSESARTTNVVDPNTNISPSSNFSDKEYITLISAEKFEFILSKKAAAQSKYLHQLITDDVFQTSNRITLHDISTDVLELLCQFLVDKSIKGNFMSTFNPLQDLDPQNPDHRQIVIELLLASNYLDC
ncbi:hypothetical protein C9374_006263 [Naegleria lovaniensis]|uniref:Elongin-C n=1 Tax=Naegleria lovaniensis TaxID=51637 RepID=A0AA88KH17_NAELO|nr:uncharacterized protein C9374_006263 [Naegleria lovaniensis]KAG2381274.1 hypothetical protein C9374_006263 [Naegleria lovaniensis]